MESTASLAPPPLQVATPPVAQDLMDDPELCSARSRSCDLGESLGDGNSRFRERCAGGSSGSRSVPPREGLLRMLETRARHENCVQHLRTLAQRVAALEAENSQLRCGKEKLLVQNQDLHQQLQVLKDTSRRPADNDRTPIGSVATALSSTVTVAEETDGCQRDRRSRSTRTSRVPESKQRASSSKQTGYRIYRLAV
mmetsp:Transcript_78266/g.155109  ORF Transcript_78266/g.155109 Transcript_78266/m.155109 type:complete len:197 (-) Transcript_78266:108-698(-)